MRNGEKTPAAIIATMREMRADGYTPVAIAQHVGLSAACVRRYTADIEVQRDTPLGNDERQQLLERWIR